MMIKGTIHQEAIPCDNYNNVTSEPQNTWSNRIEERIGNSTTTIGNFSIPFFLWWIRYLFLMDLFK